MDVTTPRQVGKSSMTVTPLGFGGGTIGSPQVGNHDSLETVAAAWETGVRLYDTAPWYGIGRSERRLGMALAGIEGPTAREDYCINTKVGKTLVAEPERDESRRLPTPGGEVKNPRDARTGFRIAFDYTYEAIHQQHSDSLQRLGHSRVDSLTIHDLDLGYHHPAEIEEHLAQLSRDGGGGARALEELRDEGAIAAIGCGCNLEARNAYSWEDGAHEDLMERIADTVDLDFLIVAGGYTLLETRALRRLMPLCEERRMGVVIAAPYASGWLVAPENGATYMYAPPPDDIVEKSKAMAGICANHGVPLAAAALQFTLAHPVVATAIPGAKTPEEARDNHRLVNTAIPAEVWRELKQAGLLPEAAPTPQAGVASSNGPTAGQGKVPE